MNRPAHRSLAGGVAAKNEKIDGTGPAQLGNAPKASGPERPIGRARSDARCAGLRRLSSLCTWNPSSSAKLMPKPLPVQKYCPWKV